MAAPKSQLFEIHGSKLKPHPMSDSGQTSVMSVTHAMFFLGVGKDPFNGLFAHRVNILASLCFPQLFHQVKVFLPDMGGEDTLALFVGSANLPAGTMLAYLWSTAVSLFSIPAGGSVPELLAPGALKPVTLRVISKLPGMKFIFAVRATCSFWYFFLFADALIWGPSINTISMMVGMLPVSAFAADTGDSSTPYASTGSFELNVAGATAWNVGNEALTVYKTESGTTIGHKPTLY